MTLQNVNKKSEVYLFRLLSSATFLKEAYIAVVSPSVTLLVYINCTRLVALAPQRLSNTVQLARGASVSRLIPIEAPFYSFRGCLHSLLAYHSDVVHFIHNLDSHISLGSNIAPPLSIEWIG